MDGSKGRLLIVDDEEALREGLRVYLELEGYLVDVAASAEEVLTMNLSLYDLMLLDIMMGEMSGTELAEKLKENPETADIPIIFLTAKTSDADTVEGLRLGADDYIPKPYSIKVVLARIEAVLRRTRQQDVVGQAAVDGVSCDRTALTCTVDGRVMLLPRKEFELLALFLENKGRIFSREELMARIWPDQTVVTDRTVDVHITKLRGKITPYGNHIVTRSGYGYGWMD